MHSQTRKLSLCEYLQHLRQIGCNDAEIEIIKQKWTKKGKEKNYKEYLKV